MFRQLRALCALSGILVLIPAAGSAATIEHDVIPVEGTDVADHAGSQEGTDTTGGIRQDKRSRVALVEADPLDFIRCRSSATAFH